MTPKIIDPTLSVSEQIKPDDIAALAASGFKSLICNRPDAEAAGQPAFAEIETAAKSAGLSAAYQPVVSGKVGDEEALAFGRLMDALPKPILAYCKTGTRSTTLWSLSEAARGRPLPDVLASAKAAGYDMTEVVRRIAHAKPSLLPDHDG
ncbi:MAG: TIGR01244 family phosphatase [Bosea sp.]|nr:TIGR01244 family phosphatase [Bosea sp. (in: a-proteobacteria)]